MQIGKAFSSKLSRKGLIVIAIPILFSLVFIVSLQVLLNQAQAQLERETRAKEIIANASGVGEAVVAAIISGYDSSFTPGAHKADALIESKRLIQERFDALSRAVPPNGRQAELVDSIGKHLHVALSLVEHTDSHLNLRTVAGLANLQQLLETRKQLRRAATGMEQDAIELITIERQSQSHQPISYERYRSLIDILLYGGMAVDVLLAIGLMTYFSKDISDRLNVLMDNSHKIVEEKELNPTVKGDDEIRQLDEVFHEMAVKLAASRGSERLMTERMRSIVETIPLGLVVIGDGDKIVSLNPGAERMFRARVDVVQGKSVLEILDSLDSKMGGRSVEDFVSQSSAAPQRFLGKTVDSATFPCEIVCAHYSTAEMDGKLLVITDITERQQIERMKQSFIAMVSHELRSPLTSIQVCFEMLSRNVFGELNENGVAAVDIAGESVQRLVRLVNEILDAERLESGRIAVALASVELAPIIDLSVGSVRSLAEASGIEIEVSCAEMAIDADRDKLVQVLVNLLSNAIKFSPPTSRIRIAAVGRPGEFVEVRVSDSGRGIPPGQLNLVFDRFHQVLEDDSKENRGTGLGLAICKGIIEAHGGEIGVESELGSGSTFWFRIPAKAVQAAAVE